MNTTLRLAKQNHPINLLEKEKNSMRNIRKVLNSIIRPNSHIKCSEKFVSENDIYTCPNEIASKFNQYVANIDPKLASAIHRKGKNRDDHLKYQCQLEVVKNVLNSKWLRTVRGSLHMNIVQES